MKDRVNQAMASGARGMRTQRSHDSPADELAKALRHGYKEESMEELTGRV